MSHSHLFRQIIYHVQSEQVFLFLFPDASSGIHMNALLRRYDQANSLDTTQVLLTQSTSKGPANRTYHERGALSRRKRDILFPNGVKLCSQETVQQVIDNHLSYFHLRGKLMCWQTSFTLREDGFVFT